MQKGLIKIFHKRLNPVSNLEKVMKNEVIIFTRDIEVSRVEKPKVESEDLQKNGW